jgi:hypothetical protein
MSSYDGLQVVPGYGSQHPEYEAPIPVPQYSYEKETQNEAMGAGRDSTGKPILGLRRTTFWLVFAIVVLVIVGAVGGGVGGSLANKKTTSNAQPASQRFVFQSMFTCFVLLLDLDLRGSSSGSATQPAPSRTSATSSSSTLSTSTSTSSTASASTPIPTTSGYTGCPGIDGTLFTAPSGAKFLQHCNYDIESSTELNFDYQATQNFDDCINLCDATNVRNQNTECKALTYNYVGLDYLLCWLKNGTGTLELDTAANNVGNYSVSAVLQ